MTSSHRAAGATRDETMHTIDVSHNYLSHELTE